LCHCLQLRQNPPACAPWGGSLSFSCHCAIAADLADDVDGSRRSIALALSRMADGTHLLVEQALNHLDEPEMASIIAKQHRRAR